MTININHLLATRTSGMQANAIREILKVVAQPGMTSLAGGIPAPESFPLEIMQDLTATVFAKYGPQALQYDASEGFAPLQAALSTHLKPKGVNVTPEQILICSGSQSILDLVAKILISPGDCIAVEAPTYLGALSAFNPYEPVYARMETDANGLLPESLDEVLRSQAVKFVYLTPTFQNPTGRTIPLERRQRIAEVIRAHGALLLEDDPYGELRYRGTHVPLLKSLAPDNVIYASSFSKIFAPGLRLGYCVAPEPVRRWLVLARQGVDLHTSTFNQALAAEYLAGGHLTRHLPRIINLYRPKQEAMLSALDRYFPEGVEWSHPDGGMFIWVEGPESLDMEKVYWRAVEQKVAFVPGKFFFTETGAGSATMRLNFTMADPPTIERAISVIADCVRQEMAMAQVVV